MKRAGVIGYPLAHSLSPVIFQPAFSSAGVDGEYEAWETPEADLAARIDGLRADDVLGANVTIPYKEAVLPLLDRLDETAEAVRAVNTIAKEGDALVGYNTDVRGFDRALREDGAFDPKGKRAVVVGAGGAARAVTFALIEGSASIVLVVGRTPKRMTQLVNDLRDRTSAGITITWAQWSDGTFLRVLPEADLVVNCTPVGTRGSGSEDDALIAADLLPADGLVFDLVYNPPVTALLRTAKERGARILSGLPMLVYQAAESCRLWTGKEAPVKEMLEAGRRALSDGSG
ncbi:MAG: shikimate dehydrogenase [Chloroflexi bacterium]|nr:shikimate dehydrogenase [Chloroflexota bacterium]